MIDLYITQVLPNPPGRDRPPHGGPTNEQLNREWVEFTNASGRVLDMNGVQLLHFTFDRRCQKTGEDRLTTFSGEFNPGYSLRVHSGFGEVSWEGTIRHVYVGSPSYAWNNACGDTAVLRNGAGTLVDWASYAPNPPEGKVLRRVSGTNKLQ